MRGITILYDQAMEGTIDPIVVAMSSAFVPFASYASPMRRTGRGARSNTAPAWW